mgnify:CR=1 FL=1
MLKSCLFVLSWMRFRSSPQFEELVDSIAAPSSQFVRVGSGTLAAGQRTPGAQLSGIREVSDEFASRAGDNSARRAPIVAVRERAASPFGTEDS